MLDMIKALVSLMRLIFCRKYRRKCIKEAREEGWTPLLLTILPIVWFWLLIAEAVVCVFYGCGDNIDLYEVVMAGLWILVGLATLMLLLLFLHPLVIIAREFFSGRMKSREEARREEIEKEMEIWQKIYESERRLKELDRTDRRIQKMLRDIDRL